MSRTNPFTKFFSQNDFSKLFENYQSSAFDMNAFLETQRKNVQAMTEAQALALENIKEIAQRQSEVLSQIVEDNSAMARGLMTEGTPEEKIAKNADMFKSVYERSIKNLQEISDIIGKSNQETSKIINKRVAATMNEIKTAVEHAEKSKKAA